MSLRRQSSVLVAAAISKILISTLVCGNKLVVRLERTNSSFSLHFASFFRFSLSLSLCVMDGAVLSSAPQKGGKRTPILDSNPRYFDIFFIFILIYTRYRKGLGFYTKNVETH